MKRFSGLAVLVCTLALPVTQAVAASKPYAVDYPPMFSALQGEQAIHALSRDGNVPDLYDADAVVSVDGMLASEMRVAVRQFQHSRNADDKPTIGVWYGLGRTLPSANERKLEMMVTENQALAHERLVPATVTHVVYQGHTYWMGLTPAGVSSPYAREFLRFLKTKGALNPQSQVSQEEASL